VVLLNEQAVSAIAFPSGSDKLYTGSTDETARIWDCQSGKVVIICFVFSFLGAIFVSILKLQTTFLFPLMLSFMILFVSLE